MPIHTPEPMLEPLMRSILKMPPSLVRYAPVSITKPLRTVLLRDTTLAQGLNASFDDSCRLTVIDGDQDRLTNVKLVVPPHRREFSGVHLVVLTTLGQINLSLSGNDIRVFIGVGCNIRAVVQFSNQPTLFIGDGTTIAQARMLITMADLSIGDDCQILDDVLFQCSDPHSISDMRTGELLNSHRRRVSVGRHVLIGRRVMVMPDVRIEEGSIVSGGSVVSADVAANTLVGGSPAVLVRGDVGWSREFGGTPPTPTPPPATISQVD